MNKGQLNLVSLDEEWQLGAQLEKEIASQMTLVNDDAALSYVSEIGQRIVARTELANVPWKFHIVASPDINAFNIPGGHVYVNTGLILAAKSTSELAGVMAHEISHGVSRHATERLSTTYGLNIGAGLLLGNNPSAIKQIATQIAATGVVAKFSRADEQEADRLGVRYMYEAGYDPEGMAKMFEELLRQRKSRPGSVEQFFSSHPLAEDRIAAVRQQAKSLPDKAGLIANDGRLAGDPAAHEPISRLIPGCGVVVGGPGILAVVPSRPCPHGPSPQPGPTPRPRISNWGERRTSATPGRMPGRRWRAPIASNRWVPTTSIASRGPPDSRGITKPTSRRWNACTTFSGRRTVEAAARAGSARIPAPLPGRNGSRRCMGRARGAAGRAPWRRLRRAWLPAVPKAYFLLFRKNDASASRDAAVEAVTISERFGDPELVSLGRAVHGQTLIALDEHEAGMALLDQAMLPVTSGQLSPMVTGIVYCTVIGCCQRVYAIDRSREWTMALETWCDAQPQLGAFTGLSRTSLGDHAAPRRLAGGDRRGSARGRAIATSPEPAAVAAAFYQQGEISRLRGEFDAAEAAYRTASELGRAPQPGLALLRLAQGRPDVAAARDPSGRRPTPEPFARTRYLPAPSRS